MRRVMVEGGNLTKRRMGTARVFEREGCDVDI